MVLLDDQQEENDGITENLQNRLINIEEEDNFGINESVK